MDKIDPICGMVGTLPAHDHWFCSQHCIKTYEQQQGIAAATTSTEGDKRIAYVLIAVIVLGGVASRYTGYMQQFMGRFFVVVSVLKFLDLAGFVEAYSKYDLIAMRWKSRGWIYPFVELAIGLAFLLNRQVSMVAAVTLILMIVGTIGVGKQLASGEKFKCACLGTKLNVPLTNLTLVEDILMGVMSIMLLV